MNKSHAGGKSEEEWDKVGAGNDDEAPGDEGHRAARGAWQWQRWVGRGATPHAQSRHLHPRGPRLHTTPDKGNELHTQGALPPPLPPSALQPEQTALKRMKSRRRRDRHRVEAQKQMAKGEGVDTPAASTRRGSRQQKEAQAKDDKASSRGAARRSGRRSRHGGSRSERPAAGGRGQERRRWRRVPAPGRPTDTTRPNEAGGPSTSLLQQRQPARRYVARARRRRR